MRERIGLLAALFFAATLDAQQPFHAAVAGDDVFGCFIIPLAQSRIQWIVPDAEDDGIETIATGDGVRVLGLRTGLGTRIVQVEPDGTQTPFYENLTFRANSIAVAPSGRVFVTTFSSGAFQLRVISPAGALEATYPLPADHVPLSLTLADDGCTLFYVDRFQFVRRINGCTGAPLPDFGAFAPGSILNDVDPLPTGQVLVAIDNRVVLYDAAGTFIRNVALLPSYGISDEQTVGQVIASNDLSTVWLTASGCDTQGVLLRVAFSDGAELARRNTMNSANALILGAGLAGVPTAGGGALLLLALGMCTVAIVILKGR